MLTFLGQAIGNAYTRGTDGSTGIAQSLLWQNQPQTLTNAPNCLKLIPMSSVIIIVYYLR